MATDLEIAWAAGLFEGEGCIGIWLPPSQSKHWRNPQVKLAVSMTDRDVLREYHAKRKAVA